jgi:hypothetical protein
MGPARAVSGCRDRAPHTARTVRARPVGRAQPELACSEVEHIPDERERARAGRERRRLLAGEGRVDEDEGHGGDERGEQRRRHRGRVAAGELREI